MFTVVLKTSEFLHRLPHNLITSKLYSLYLLKSVYEILQSSDTKSSLRTAISVSTTNANSECTIHCNSPHNLTQLLMQQ